MDPDGRKNQQADPGQSDIPPYGEMPGSVAAVIEYAVGALQITSVVTRGHSDCGAMKGA